MGFENKTVWIIGASSGIGEALAKELAARGAILVLSARRENKLVELQRELGEKHSIRAMDIVDADSVAVATRTVFSRHERIDSVIVLAALYEPLSLVELTPEKTRHIIDTNLMGSFHMVQAVLPLLLQQGGGQLALCGSVAGFMGLPGGQPYSATKAAIINLAESLHAEHGREIDIKLINPGFVRTPMTAKNDFSMPMIITPEQAAQAIANGLEKRGFEIHFPKGFTLLLKLLRLLPYPLSLFLTRNLKKH